MPRWPLPTLALLALAMPGAALAKQAVTLDSQMFVERTATDINGQARHVLAPPGQRIGTGDRLVFVMRYRNAGTAPVEGFAVTNPVPSSLRIDADHPEMQISVDGGRHWGRLGALQMATPLGGTRLATADDVTHIRWAVPTVIRPGDEGRISYRATVR